MTDPESGETELRVLSVSTHAFDSNSIDGVDTMCGSKCCAKANGCEAPA